MLMSVFQRVPLQSSTRAVYSKVRAAIEALRSLPDDQKEMAARAILNYAAQDDEWKLTDEQVVEVQCR
jgi:Domain of unknown function (DUF4111)